MKYCQISIITTHESADLVSLLLIDLGSEGTVIKDAEDIKELYNSNIIWDYVDSKVLEQNNIPVTVIGFFNENFNKETIYSALKNLRENCNYCGSLECSSKIIDSADWENEWKKYYTPIRLGKVIIIPKWIEKETSLITVKLDPGMAFGTGNHETTAACIELMQEIELKDKTIFDVGCGSGILGITAAKLGAKIVVMSDIDSVALDAAKANSALNDVQDKIIVTNKSPKDFGYKADLILANITVDILKSYIDEFYDNLNSDGYLILSGIISERYIELKDFYLTKFELLRYEHKGEWCAMLMKKA